jgi:hypothetical protein
MPGNLVFTSAGDNTNFIKWWATGKDTPDYDIFVYYYGDSEENYNKYKEHVCYIEKSNGSKFQNFYKFWMKFLKIIEDYDRFFILDDDIEFSISDINEMFKISEEYDLLICQPSFTDRSKTSYEINKFKNNRILTYTNFVEVNTPLFHKQAIEKLMNVFDPSLEEWGVDYLYILINGIEKQSSYAIIHKIQCTNPLSESNTNLNSKNREINKLHSEQYRMAMWRNYMSKNNISQFSISPVEYKSIYNEINLLVVVISCKKNQHLWPKIIESGINLVILCGGSDSDSYLDSKILYLNCSDLYEGLPEKMICAIDFILGYPEFKSVTHILKIDDHDTVITKDIIDNIELNHTDILNTKEYIGQTIWTEGNFKHHYGKVTPNSYWKNRPFIGPKYEFADGGDSYILNRYAMKCINTTYNTSNLIFLRHNYILEDVMIGIILKSYNIIPYKLNYGIRKITNIQGEKKNPVKLLVVVVSCKKHEYLWPVILERGIENLVILCGGYHSDSYLESNILHLNCSDLYEGLPEKMICAIDFIRKCPEFESVTHILKVDDHDTHFDRNIIESIEKLNTLYSNDYIGQMLRYEDIKLNYHMNNTSSNSIWKNKSYNGNISMYCDGGRSYILSRYAIECINNTFNLNNLKYVRNNYIYEDLMIGLILNAYNIYPFELNYGIHKISSIPDPNIIISKPVILNSDNKWIHIGYEREKFTLPIGSHLRFGHDDKWLEQVIDVESFKADRWFFRGDPFHGINKRVEYNLFSKIEKDTWIRIGYEDSQMYIPVTSLISFGNNQDGWIEKTVEESCIIASKEFFESTKQYNHRNEIRILIKG